MYCSQVGVQILMCGRGGALNAVPASSVIFPFSALIRVLIRRCLSCSVYYMSADKSSNSPNKHPGVFLLMYCILSSSYVHWLFCDDKLCGLHLGKDFYSEGVNWLEVDIRGKVGCCHAVGGKDFMCALYVHVETCCL